MELTRPSFDERELDLVKECLASGWVTQGPMVQRFEALMAAEHAVDFALATTSCTAALHLAAMALELGPGDEVLVPAFTWVTSAHSIAYVGADPVFVDIDLDTYNIDIAALEGAISDRTRAIMAVHLFGLPCDMAPLLAIAKRHGLLVIEDAACAVGSRYRGQPVGGIGDVGCFSFHPRKVITTGEGGMVTTRSESVARRVASLRNHGATGLPSGTGPNDPWAMSTFDNLGYNLRMSDIQAAIGVAQMAKLNGLITHRRRQAGLYDEALTGFDWLVTPGEPEYALHTYQSYVVRLADGDVTDRNAIMMSLADRGIQTRPGTHAVPDLGYYKRRAPSSEGRWPMARQAQDMTITLPLFPAMTEGDVGKVVQALVSARDSSRP
ncbi:MAG: DegT/DnrJ/EryC1/StrS family aminotransferase [Actinomycetota bacterium]|nr:DegT/DnrJ/EryC1/StrS family aminotransferase [Actinomycetota bacterium]